MKLLNNIDKIIKELSNKDGHIKEIKKLDGITFEVIIKEKANRDNVIKTVEDLCKDLKLPSTTIEKQAEDETRFAVQFPDLDPKYTKDEMAKLINHNIKWCIDNINTNNIHGELTKEDLKYNSNIIVKQVIVTYYNSNVNRYKVTLKDTLNSLELRDLVQTLLNEFLDH